MTFPISVTSDQWNKLFLFYIKVCTLKKLNYENNVSTFLPWIQLILQRLIKKRYILIFVCMQNKS